MKKKILFLDLDGTLLTDAKEITEGNYRALQRALAAGHRVVVTTGRPLAGAIRQNDSLGLNLPGCYLIAYNGGEIYEPYSKQVIYRHGMSPQTALAAMKIADELDVHIQTFDEEKVLVAPHRDDEEVRRYCSKIHMEHRVVPSFEEELTYDPIKALAIDFEDRGPLIALRDRILAELGDRLDSFFSSQFYLEIAPKDTNKGQAICRMCEILGIDIDDAIAVGDEANDISMIRAAGVGVAMANAIPEAKEAADYVTVRDNNHDGIVEVVEKFMVTEV